MKQIFTLITAMLTCLTMMAQPMETSMRRNNNQGMLTISSFSKGQIRVLVDGNTYNKNERDNDISFTDIRAGYHTVKIYQQKYNSNYSNLSYNNMQLVYDATIYIRPQIHIDIIVNRFGKAFVDERQSQRSVFQ